MKTIFVTGAAGFIGFHLSLRLLEEGHQVVGYDQVNDYYDTQLKRDRLSRLAAWTGFVFVEDNLENKEKIFEVFERYPFDAVVHLAAQAGVRHSLQNPDVYVSSNMLGFLNILEGCRNYRTGHLIYASSSSVYGANTAMPFSAHQSVDHPVSIYAATKKSNELMAHAYSHLYQLPTTGLRFFTVYGPWGRPDMAYFSFTKDIVSGRPIKIFNNGRMRRDFTYIDDVVDGMIRLLNCQPEPNLEWSGRDPDPATSYAPYRIYNMGNNRPVELLRLIRLLEENLGLEAKKEWLPMQPGDVMETFADIDDLIRDVGFQPKTTIEEGIAKFVKWYQDYYH